MVPNSQIEVGRVTGKIGVSLEVGDRLVGSYIESFSDVYSDFFIFGSVIDVVLSNELKRIVSLIFLK